MSTSDTPNKLTLFELNNQLKAGVREIFPDHYWVVGEINEINLNQSGHCYLELIEKNPDSEQIIARSKATIWAFTFRMLRPYFESVTGQRFTTGIKVMVQVSVEFHEVYGFSLNIKDIEPNFTIGDLSRKRQEIIQRLQDEGVFHLNKELDLPLVPQRIAVISSETAAGYEDFTAQLKNNHEGYAFHIKLFQAVMQGAEAEGSIIAALENIFLEIEKFDVIVIIRGGGSQADLNCFNSYWLCYHITQIPLPIITGIGHERDETIADLVAHTSLKTPTAVAEYIIQTVAAFDEHLNNLNDQVLTIAVDQIQTWKHETERLSRDITTLLKLKLNNESQKIQTYALLTKNTLKGYLLRNQQRLTLAKTRVRTQFVHFLNQQKLQISLVQKNFYFILKSSLREEKNKLSQFENANHLLNPENILQRGYSLIFSHGMLIKRASQLKPGDVIESKWIDGSAFSTIEKIQQPKP